MPSQVEISTTETIYPSLLGRARAQESALAECIDISPEELAKMGVSPERLPQMQTTIARLLVTFGYNTYQQSVCDSMQFEQPKPLLTRRSVPILEIQLLPGKNAVIKQENERIKASLDSVTDQATDTRAAYETVHQHLLHVGEAYDSPRMVEVHRQMGNYSEAIDRLLTGRISGRLTSKFVQAQSYSMYAELQHMVEFIADKSMLARIMCLQERLGTINSNS
jgi:hypothetical protein